MTRDRWRFALLALVVLATSVWAGGRLHRLQAVRAERAALRNVARQSVAGVPVWAGDPVPRIRAAVPGAGVRLIGLTAGRRGGVAHAELVLSGPELAVRRAIARIEPHARFGSWRMTPEPGSADRVRFEAVAYAVPRTHAVAGAGR